MGDYVLNYVLAVCSIFPFVVTVRLPGNQQSIEIPDHFHLHVVQKCITSCTGKKSEFNETVLIRSYAKVSQVNALTSQVVCILEELGTVGKAL